MKSTFAPFGWLALGVLILALAMPLADAQQPRDSVTEEQRLLTVLQSDAPSAQKAISCKELAIYGSGKAVPELAKLLPDPQLSSWARIALEVIPGEQANAALRTAAESMQGQLLVGVINTIGVRRDSQAVPILIGHLKDDDVEVASASAVALGRIADDDARKALQAALATVDEEEQAMLSNSILFSMEEENLLRDSLKPQSDGSTHSTSLEETAKSSQTFG